MLAETPVTQRSSCYSAVSSSLTNPLPDCSNYSPFCHTHYLTPDQYFTSLFGVTKPLCWRIILHCCSTLLQNLVGNSGEMQCLEEAEQQTEVCRCSLSSSNCKLSSLFLYPLSAPFLNPLSFPSPPSLLSLLINSLSS